MYLNEKKDNNALQHVKIFVLPVVVLSGKAVLESQEPPAVGIITVSCARGLLVFVSVTPRYSRELGVPLPNLDAVSQESPLKTENLNVRGSTHCEIKALDSGVLWEVLVQYRFNLVPIGILYLSLPRVDVVGIKVGFSVQHTKSVNV